MRSSVASAALVAAFVLAPSAAGHAPALGQDFSITNQVAPATVGRRDVMRQLQAWWDAHAYYPRHASDRNQAGTVELALVIRPDGRIWTIDVMEGSGSQAIDAAAEAVFRGGSVRSFPPGEHEEHVDVTLHYVLTHRRDQTAAAGYAPAAPKSPFTITNDPVTSPILDTMLQRTCTGTMTLGGVPNEPIYGVRSRAEAIFFLKPDGTPWVKFFERGHVSLAPVTQIGKMVTWSGRQEHTKEVDTWLQYTMWPDGDNHLSGAIGGRKLNMFGVASNSNLAGSSLDLTCGTEVLPTITSHGWLEEQNTSTVVSPLDLAPADPP